LANEQVFYDFFSDTLPPDQWKLEVSLWYQTSLTKLQELMAAFVQVEELDFPDLHIFTPDNSTGNMTAAEKDAMRNQCSNQKIQTRGQVQNFNLIALICVAVLSVLLLIMGCALEPCVKMWRKRKPTTLREARQHARDIDYIFYVLRAGLEGVGVRPWKKGGKKEDSDVPVMQGSPLLEALVVSGSVQSGFYKPQRVPNTDRQPGASAPPQPHFDAQLGTALTTSSPQTSQIPLHVAPPLTPRSMPTSSQASAQTLSPVIPYAQATAHSQDQSSGNVHYRPPR
jgi:hypothetical protein